jgi:uncharacterized protein (DUF885 family)
MPKLSMTKGAKTMADIQEAIAQEIRFTEADRKRLEMEISDLTNRVEVLIPKRIAGIP